MAEPRAALREALLDQLAYLVDEIEALRGIVHRVPEPVLTARPPGEALSIKQAYGVLAVLDEAVHLPRFRRLAAEDEPAFEPPDPAGFAAHEAWDDAPIDALLARVQAARRALVAFLRTLPPDAWARTATVDGVLHDGYALAHAVTQHDADLLRPVGYRLHEARLTGRSGAQPQ